MFRRKERISLQQRKRLNRKRQSRGIFLLVLEFLMLAALILAAFMMYKLDQLDHNTLDESSLELHETPNGYTNVALFGLDSREGELDGGVRSDSIMVVSINNKTGAVQIVSVFRDTLLQQQDGSYEKANAAYSFGGPQEAVAMLNRNLDLDITRYASVNFNALADIIDILGGIEVELTSEEIFWLNGYTAETSQVVGRQTNTLDENAPGVHKLDGIQAVSYTRIRYTAGDDFKRAERQRIVLQEMIQKLKTAGPIKWNRIMDQVLPQISTNMTTPDIMKLGLNIFRYQIGETKGFPFDITTSDNVIGLEGSYAVAIGHADNVRQLHEHLFQESGYEPSEKVQQISQDVAYLTGVYPENYMQ